MLRLLTCRTSIPSLLMSRNKRKGANENEKSLYQRFMRISLIFPFVALLMSSDKGSLFNSMSENKHPKPTNEEEKTVNCDGRRWRWLETTHFYSKWKLNGEFIFSRNCQNFTTHTAEHESESDGERMWMVVCMHDYGSIKMRRAINAKCEDWNEYNLTLRKATTTTTVE